MTNKRKGKATTPNKRKRAPKVKDAPKAPIARPLPEMPSSCEDIATLARYAYGHFTRKTREGGTEFWHTLDGTPEWIKTMCMEAHETMLPEDFKYEFIVEALSALSDHDDADSARDSLEPDIYNSELHRWLSSHLERAGFVDEAVSEYGHADSGIDGDLAQGQLREKHQVFDSVRDSLESFLSELG